MADYEEMARSELKRLESIGNTKERLYEIGVSELAALLRSVDRDGRAAGARECADAVEKWRELPAPRCAPEEECLEIAAKYEDPKS